MKTETGHRPGGRDSPPTPETSPATVSDCMFGERYFATRERLADLMRGIAALAAETGTDLGEPPAACGNRKRPGHAVPLRRLRRGQCRQIHPDQRPLRPRPLPGQHPPGNPPRAVVSLRQPGRATWRSRPLLEERYRPLEFLRDFNLVDTPGTNSAHPRPPGNHRALPARRGSVLVVFPVSNPWGAATWDFISRLPARGLARVVLIIQQADQRDPNDIEVILGHMADLSMKRIGRVPPIFAVSGKLACEAKRATPPAKDRLQASGYPALEDFISTKHLPVPRPPASP